MSRNGQTPAPVTGVSGDVELVVSAAHEHPDWDAFLARTEGGHHVQTSMWGRVKGSLGWRTVRVVARRAGRIIGGGQLLLRPLPVGGNVGFIPKGPLLEHYDESVADLLLATLHRVAVDERVRFLMVQPPIGAHDLAAFLERRGLQPSPVRTGPVGTTRVDLRPEPDTLLKNMKSKTRYNIRLADRKGVTVREGGVADLPTFHRLLMATAERQGFGDYGLFYFEAMEQYMGPGGHVQLMIAEYEGKILSSLLLVPFGDTVLFKKGGWSGEHGNLHPNERLHWASMLWAREHGYRYYDFEGIDETVARTLIAGKKPEGKISSVTRFKLGFGGEVRVDPGTYDHLYHPLLRWSYRRIYPRVAGWSLTDQLLHRYAGR